MAVTATRLDGQNVGIRLLGQVSAGVISLNLTTGDVVSPYFGEEDCRILRQFALSLFRVVPVSARPGAAIGLLSRLCAVSPADSSTLTLTAAVSQGVATLTANVTASPASLLLTIPFAPAGGAMPGMVTTNAQGASGGNSYITLPYEGPLLLGDAVVRMPTTGRVRRADPWTESLMPAIGIVVEWSSGEAQIQLDGIVSGLYGATAQPLLFVGENGRLVPIADAIPRVQMMGYWLDSSRFKLNIDPRAFIRA